MTVLDAANLLYEWFGNNDSFEMNRDLKKVVPIIDNEEETTSAFKLALVDLEGNTMISSQDYGDRKFYILCKPYDAYNQNIEMSSFTSKWMAAEINEFCGLIEDNTDLCTASAINDKDVRNLVHIIQFYKQKMSEKEEIISKYHGMDDLAEDLDVIGGQKILNELLSKGYDQSDDKKDDDDDDDDDDGGKKKKNKKKK